MIVGVGAVRAQQPLNILESDNFPDSLKTRSNYLVLLHITDMQASIELSQKFVCYALCFVWCVMCDTGDDDDMQVTQVLTRPHSVR